MQSLQLVTNGGQVVTGQIVPMEQRHFEDVEGLWQPILCETNQLTFARLRSVELGYGGRVGLHSLPNAEGFYEQLQMSDYGPDLEKNGLVYFEYGVIQR